MRESDADERWMRLALAAARGGAAGASDAAGASAASAQEVPVGAVVIAADGRVLASAGNERESSLDPTAHAEVLAIRRAAEVLGSRRLAGATLVVTLEPCVMCAGAILAAELPRVVFGAWDAKAGAAGSVHDLLRDRRLPRRAEVVGGVLEAECQALLTEFFAARRGR